MCRVPKRARAGVLCVVVLLWHRASSSRALLRMRGWSVFLNALRACFQSFDRALQTSWVAVPSVWTGIPPDVHSVRRVSLCTACIARGTNGLATGGVFASPIRRTYFPLVASAACRDSDIETLRSIETRRSTWLKPQQLRSAEESAGRSAGRGWVQCCPWSPPLLPLPP